MIKCISKYTSSLGSFLPGDRITIPSLAAALLADSRDSFVLEADEVQPVTADKAEPVAGAPEADRVPLVSKPARGYRRKA